MAERDINNESRLKDGAAPLRKGPYVDVKIARRV